MKKDTIITFGIGLVLATLIIVLDIYEFINLTY